MDGNLEKIVEKIVRETLAGKSTNPDTRGISLKAAKQLAEKIEQKAEEMGVNAVVAIADAGARTVLVESMDGAYIASYDIAVNKAYTSVALKMSTYELGRLSQPGGELYGIAHTNGGRIVIFGGGEVLKLNGKVVGGLGVSGGSEEQDRFLGEYGKKLFNQMFS